MKLLTNEQICEDVLGWRLSAIKSGCKKCWEVNGKVVAIDPLFDEDLQACFDYIVPMLDKKGFCVSVITSLEQKYFVLIDEIRGMSSYNGNNKKPAPAFIEALTKWWESQKEK